MNEIIPHLFLGNINNSAVFDGIVITVIGDFGEDKHKETLAQNATWIPILKHLPQEIASKDQLNACAEAIESSLDTGKDVLVHCWVGMERSPLAVAWFLHKKRGMTMDDAYNLIISKRPFVQRRDFLIRDK